MANGTAYDVNNLVINAFSREKFIQLVPARLTSDYKSFPYAYSYIGLEFDINGIVFNYQPTEYRLDERLEGDRYEIVLLNADTVLQTFSYKLQFVE